MVKLGVFKEMVVGIKQTVPIVNRGRRHKP